MHETFINICSNDYINRYYIEIIMKLFSSIVVKEKNVMTFVDVDNHGSLYIDFIYYFL